MRWPWRTESPVPAPARRQIALIAAVLILVSGGLVAAALAYLRADALRSGQKLTGSFVQVIEEQTSRTFQAADQRLQLAASQLQALQAQGRLNEDSARAMLREQLRALAFVRAIWVLDAKGRIVFDSDVGNIGVILADREYFSIHQERPGTQFHINAPVRSRSTGGWVIAVSRPLRNAAGEVTGVIAAGVDPPWFDKLWRGLDLGPGGAVALFRRDGVLMMRSPVDESAMGKAFGSMPLFTTYLPRSPAGTNAVTSTFDAQSRIASYRTLSTYPELIVAVGRTYDDILGPWYRFSAVACLTWLVASVAVIMLSGMLQRQSRQRERTELRFRQAADALRTQNHLVRMAGQLSRLGGWALELPSMRFIWSDEASEILRLPPGSAPTLETAIELCAPADRELATRVARECVTHGTPFDVEVEMLTPTGVNIHVRSMGRALRDAEGNITRMQGAFQDITSRVKAERENLALLAQVQELNNGLEEKIARRTSELRLSNAELEAFSYSVSHDLRSPLGTVNGFSRLLAQELGNSGNARVAHYLDRIQAGVGQMGQLIDGLLSLAHVSRVELRREPVDLSAIANDILHRLQAHDRERQCHCHVEPGLVVNGDSRLVHSLMENLLGNAWKFSSRRAPAEISVGRSAAHGAFFVRDNGAGFDMAYSDKLFGTFQRLHDVAEFPGTGVGLATVARVIARHGGRIWAESAPDQGAVFHFTLPGG